MTDTLTSSGGASAPLNLDLGAQRAWILAGNATFTLVSNRTGARYTYKVRRDKLTTSPGGRYAVLLLTGLDNESSFTYLGALHPWLRKVETGGVFDVEEEVWEFHRGKRSEYAAESIPVATFIWMWRRLEANRPLTYDITVGGACATGGAKLLHVGRCGRCGRLLTVPESIESGYGPECVSRLGGV